MVLLSVLVMPRATLQNSWESLIQSVPSQSVPLWRATNEYRVCPKVAPKMVKLIEPVVAMLVCVNELNCSLSVEMASVKELSRIEAVKLTGSVRLKA